MVLNIACEAVRPASHNGSCSRKRSRSSRQPSHSIPEPWTSFQRGQPSGTTSRSMGLGSVYVDITGSRQVRQVWTHVSGTPGSVGGLGCPGSFQVEAMQGTR